MHCPVRYQLLPCSCSPTVNIRLPHRRSHRHRQHWSDRPVLEAKKAAKDASKEGDPDKDKAGELQTGELETGHEHQLEHQQHWCFDAHHSDGVD